MKTIILLAFLLSGSLCFGQQHQLSFQVSSGLFSFGGSSASETSFLNVSDVTTESGYTNNPYGKNSSFSYGVGIQYLKITPKNFMFGLQLSFESLSSKLTIENAYGEINWTVDEGKTILTSNFINLFPSVGQRVKLFEGVDSDFLAGFDLGIGLSSTERYSLTTSQGNGMSGTNEREAPGIDFRPRIEFVNYYKSFGLSIGYSHGLTNYQAGMDGSNREAKSRYLRFGLSYRLK
jgi:hypothetical protein